MKHSQNSSPSEGKNLQRTCIFFHQKPFHGYRFSCNNFAHKAMECRWHAMKKSVWSSNRRKDVGNIGGPNRNFVKYGNSFATFLNFVECYNYG